MKRTIFLMLLLASFSVMAKEVGTECAAMSDSRSKNLKLANKKELVRKGRATRQ